MKLKSLSILGLLTLILLSPSTTFAQSSIYIVSDKSWKYSEIESIGWHKANYDDSQWPAVQSPSSGICAPNYIAPVNLINQNGAQPVWSQTPIEGSTVYFRKSFTLASQHNGSFRINIDDDGDLYINGHAIFSNYDNSGGVTYSGDVSQYLTTGTNVIAIKVTDSAGICQSMQFELELTQMYSVPEYNMYTLLITLISSLGFYKTLKTSFVNLYKRLENSV